ncbi:MAG: helix-turn-helix transcriptional regulator [Deltaproteobacteria bacterium]|nr:helix-turn-helix transcriptional regulator [Deltaproteobacteria bacterium]
MRKGRDVGLAFEGLYLVHQNLPGKRLRRAVRQEHLLFVPLQGEIEVLLESGAVRAGPGRFLYLPPGTVHGFRASERGGERLIALVEEGAWRAAGGTVLPPVSRSAPPLIRELLFYLFLNPATAGFRGIVQTLVAILGETCGSSDSRLDLDHLEGAARDPRLRAATKYLREHLTEPLSIPALAEASGASVRTLRRLFAKELGLTPKAVLTANRIERARDLLAAGGTSVTEVALGVGYGSMSQFLAAFRKATGRLPSDFAHTASGETPPTASARRAARSF